MTYRLLVEYDGTEFHGWQFQPGLRTVQGELEKALAVLAGEPVQAAGAGRTDAGCHARGQVASFSAARRLELPRLLRSLAGLLPPDLAVRAVSQAPPGFHARRGVLERTYSYRLLERPAPLWRRTAWHPGFAPDPAALESVTRQLAGTRDFRGYAGADPARHGTDGVCRVHRAAWRRWDGGWELEIVANRFLYHMVRNIAGTAVKVARGGMTAERAARALAEADRRLAGPTAPPQGLCLERVIYAAEGGAPCAPPWRAETAAGVVP